MSRDCLHGRPPYWCPTSGEWESACCGGFDVCCDRADLHCWEHPIGVSEPTDTCLRCPASLARA